MQLSLILWDGNVGGAEKLTAELAAALRENGADARILFVRDPGPLAADLDRLRVPYESLGARRSAEVLLRPRRFARAVAKVGSAGVLLPAIGHLALALRLGGYRGPIVAIEHGTLLLMPSMSRSRRAARKLERRLSVPFVDAQVAVSGFMRDELMRTPHPARVDVIENGIDVQRYGLRAEHASQTCTFACASRLVSGKGIPELIQAFAEVAKHERGVRLAIAGDGPERARIDELVSRYGVADRTELAGIISDMPSFWAKADVAVMPSTAPESFGMVAIEAMASGLPVVSTRNGGADDVVENEATGTLVPCGDVEALAAAMLEYATDQDRRETHGRAGRARCESHFTMSRCAGEYIGLLNAIGRHELPSPAQVETPLEEVNA
jgi:glycosyltransferase involved in cell wall biosynthesis